MLSRCINTFTHTNNFLLVPLAMKSTFTPPTTICRRSKINSETYYKAKTLNTLCQYPGHFYSGAP